MLTAIMTGLTATIRRYLQFDPDTLTRLQALEGKTVKVEFTGWPWVIYLLPGNAGIRILHDYPGEVHAIVRGSPVTLLRMSFAKDQKKMQLAGSLDMTGDIELAHTLSRILEQIEMDWEEPLSQITGDVVAHQVGHLARRAHRWWNNFLPNMGQNITEYLQEEIRLLPPRQEVEDLFSEIHTLRDDVDRLAAKIDILKSLSLSPAD